MRRILALLACLLGIGDTPAFDQRTDEADLLRAKVEELERQVTVLEAKVRTLQASTPTLECEGPLPPASSKAWENPGCWEKLRKGMSRFEVLRLLGEPGKLSTYDGFERWEYPAALGARVNFDDRGALVSWRPPRPGSETRQP